MRPIILAGLALALLGSPAACEEVEEAILGYMDFAPYEAGIILPAQITPELLPQVHFIDTRDAAQFEAGHIEGAVNIDWRQIPARLDALPGDGLVVLYCNTGSLSAQATFAARVLGRDNVLVLQGGYLGWQAAGR